MIRRGPWLAHSWLKPLPDKTPSTALLWREAMENITRPKCGASLYPVHRVMASLASCVVLAPGALCKCALRCGGGNTGCFLFGPYPIGFKETSPVVKPATAVALV